MNVHQAPDSAESATTLDDKFTVERGRVFMTGTQALIRLPMLQRQRDLRAGLNTAGYLTGYRGSPLGGVDMAAAKAEQYLQAHHVKFHPGVNEDLAATAVWGTQQVNLFPDARYDGVFALWYGKGPGVDRCADVFKHANMAGSARHGGVLVVAGDDHAAKSSTTAHQSEQILQACGIPVLYPSSVQEYLDYGLHGLALSRYSGLWVGMKCVTDIVESGCSVEIDPDRVEIVTPTDIDLPVAGLNIRLPDSPLQQEERMANQKWRAALAYARANKLNRVIWDSPAARIGIVTAGKAYSDTRQALADLGIDEQAAAELGIRLYKIGMSWPLEPEGIEQFSRGLAEIVVVEEKRSFIESQLKEALFHLPDALRPMVVGKFDRTGEADGCPLLPGFYELTPTHIARAIASRIARYAGAHPAALGVRERMAELEAVAESVRGRAALGGVNERIPYFCSGCPHNTSTKVPEGSRALAGIGCHLMAAWMDRATSTYTQMGGEGMTWVGHSPFTTQKHVFANLGDGTYFHSGLLAIRAAVAAEVSMTYKILFNDAVAMTGGQMVDGQLDPGIISRQIAAEGVRPIVVVSDEPDKYPDDYAWAPGVTVRHRRDLDAVQRELRAVAGVSALIYDQTCASEKRRRRKRNAYPDPARRVVINEAVCEGCGDCGVQSNCLSIEPLETEYGRKRQINQSSCNKDFSCVNGFCPSFVTVEGGKLRQARPLAGSSLQMGFDPAQTLPTPVLKPVAERYAVLVTGIGGTGVVTVGQILAMAAHIEGLGCSVLDMSGLAQKGGAVLSHVVLAARQDDIHATRVGMGAADLVIGCDGIVAGGAEALSRMGAGTRSVLNQTSTPTAAFLKNRDWQSAGGDIAKKIAQACGEQPACVDAGRLATSLLGDSIATNMFMLGFAWQRGWVPLSEEAIAKAIGLNGTAVSFNLQAFRFGRIAAHRAIYEKSGTPMTLELLRKPTLDALTEQRARELTAYQDEAYGRVYRDFIEHVRAAESAVIGSGAGMPLTGAVARFLYKLMAYKDEYEVARLHSDGGFQKKIAEMFEGNYRIKLHLAPPLLSRRDQQGHLIKREFGSWMMRANSVLARFKFLRGGPFDIFGYSEERQQERRLLREYQATITELLPHLTVKNRGALVAIASIPDQIRGYGHVKHASIVVADQLRTRLLAEFVNHAALNGSFHESA